MYDLARYVCIARLDQHDVVFLWETGDDAPDRVVLDETGAIVTFADEHAARQSGTETLPVTEGQVTRYDLDALEAWCRSVAPIGECSPLLNAWNLFGDLPKSDLYEAVNEGATPIYDKLFWGCNLPAMTPPGEHYVPTWTETETATLKRLLLLGVAEFRARLR